MPSSRGWLAASTHVLAELATASDVPSDSHGRSHFSALHDSEVRCSDGPPSPGSFAGGVYAYTRPGVSYGYVAWRCSAEPVRRGFGSRALHQRRRRRAAGLEIDPPVDSDPLANAVQCARFARSASAVGMRGCPKRWHGNSNHSRCGAGYLMRGWAGWGRPACIRYRVRPSPAIVGGSCWQSAWHTACLGAPQPATAAPWRPCWPRRGGARRG